MSSRPTPEQVLGEVEELIRTIPDATVLGTADEEAVVWLGRAQAVIAYAGGQAALDLRLALGSLDYSFAADVPSIRARALRALHTARSAIRLALGGFESVAVPHGAVHAYFDAVRKIVEGAGGDLLFVDPYLDADFASRFLVYVRPGVQVRLLGRERIRQLLPAADMLARQQGVSIEVRSAPNFHDRFVIVDGREAFQSGASFKDGGKSSPTSLTAVQDLFVPTVQACEALWSSAPEKWPFTP